MKRCVLACALLFTVRAAGAQPPASGAHPPPWSSHALESPYRENLSEDEKVAGLSKFWAEIRFNFANFDLVPELDWDALYLAYLPKVRQTRSTLEYYHVLEELCARLKDGHTNVIPPREIAEMYDRPPLRTALVEDKVLITRVLSDRLLGEAFDAMGRGKIVGEPTGGAPASRCSSPCPAAARRGSARSGIPTRMEGNSSAGASSRTSWSTRP